VRWAEDRPAVALLGPVWRRSRAGRLLLAALAAGAALLVAVPFGDGAARLMMEKFHLRGGFLRWAALQPVPSMYNFTNVVRLDVPHGEPPSETFWVNHYPLRALTYMRRIELTQRPATLTAETRYRGLSLVTRCHTVPRGGGVDVACEALR
jgi:hypothetical protein